MTKSCRKKSHKNRCKALGYKKKKCSTSCDATTTMATTTTQATEIAGPSTRGNTYVMLWLEIKLFLIRPILKILNNFQPNF